jgi:hypothetical protein
MGERLSTMSVDDLHEARKDLVSKLKQVNQEISNRMERESHSLASERKPSAEASTSSTSTPKKIKKKVSIAETSSASSSPTKVVKKASAGAASASASSSASAAKPDTIKATIADMKAVLDDNGIAYGSTAKKEELISLVRANRLIRKAEQRCQGRKKVSGGASAENSD